MENIGYIELCLLFEQADDGLREVTLQPMQAIAPLIIGTSVLCGTSLIQPEIAQSLVLRETIQLGSQGDKVREIQTHLRDWGFPLDPSKKLAVDGVFGVRTKAAVEEFQKYHGLEVDGIIGAETYPLLSNPPNYPSQTLKKGDVGDRVKEIQTYLKDLDYPLDSSNQLVVDGIFDSRTQQAVKEFQQKYGDSFYLKPTGELDPSSYGVLAGLARFDCYGGCYPLNPDTSGFASPSTPKPPKKTGG